MRMKSLWPFILPFILSSWATTQSAVVPLDPHAVSPSLEATLSQIQRAADTTTADLTSLRIEKWKVDSAQKRDLLKMASSLRRNLTQAVPDLVVSVRSTHGSVASAFKLYHNLNIVYEYLNSLVDSAAALGKPEEYLALAHEAGTFDAARQNLSAFIEQAATSLEERAKLAQTPPPAASPTPGKKLIVDDTVPTPEKPVSQKKKKSSSAAAPASNSAEPAPSPGKPSPGSAKPARSPAKPTPSPAKPTPSPTNQ